jgi:hypothetical protein
VLLSLTTGCDVVFGLHEVDPVPPAQDSPNAYDCSCTCKRGTTTVMSLDSSVCMPADLNPNVPETPGSAPSADQLNNDCSTRVQNNVTAMVQACGTRTVTCTCEAPGGTSFAKECNGNCTDAGCDAQCPEEVLAQNCVNFDYKTHMKTATNVFGQPPVCLVSSADPPVPVPDPLAAGFFGQSSRCEVSGLVTVTQGSDSQSQSGNGVVNFTGSPCPGQGCQVGMDYRLDKVGTFGFDGFGGFDRAEIEDVAAGGATIPAAATLDASGAGTIPADSTTTSGRGKRSNQLGAPGLGCGEVSSDTAGYVGTNGAPIDIQVDWQGHECSLDGTVLGMIEGADSSVGVSLAGTIVNEPPSAKAGGTRSIECTSPSGAPVTLDATGSTDPEDNITLYVWRQDSRAGNELGTDPILHLTQALGAPNTYFLKVVDAYGQADEDSTTVTVKDSTPPTITNVTGTPKALAPPNHKMVPVTVTVAASDQCSTPTCQVTGVSSNEPINGPGDGNTNPDWQITSATTVNLRAERSGTGSGRVYTITVTCTDGSGNASKGTTAVTVAH